MRLFIYIYIYLYFRLSFYVCIYIYTIADQSVHRLCLCVENRVELSLAGHVGLGRRSVGLGGSHGGGHGRNVLLALLTQSDLAGKEP